MSSNDSTWAWDEMLAALRALGGTADNIVLGTGEFGRGLFPRDPSKPFCLHVPKRLLFPMDDIEFDADRIRIKDSSPIGEAEREFFDRYQRGFSWSIVRQDCAKRVDALDALPPKVRQVLYAEFDFGCEGDRMARTGKFFLESRMIAWEKKGAVMPVIELANHSDTGIQYEVSDGITLRGIAVGEIFAMYGLMDPFRSFLGYGFSKPSTTAYSAPMKLVVGTLQLQIDKDPETNSMNGAIIVPKLEVSGKNLSLSYLMIGNRKFPRLPRGIFRTLMGRCGIQQSGADEVFDVIVHTNRMKFYGLLELIESCEGELAVALRKVARFQLEAMSHCIGSRDPEKPVRPLNISGNPAGPP